MTASAEDVFDEAIRKAPRKLSYRGRHTLDGLDQPEFKPLLEKLKTELSAALLNAEPRAEYEAYHPFHVDYIDADGAGAEAFPYGGYSFIWRDNSNVLYSLGHMRIVE
jgi:hypothetical protein